MPVIAEPLFMTFGRGLHNCSIRRRAIVVPNLFHPIVLSPQDLF